MDSLVLWTVPSPAQPSKSLLTLTAAHVLEPGRCVHECVLLCELRKGAAQEGRPSTWEAAGDSPSCAIVPRLVYNSYVDMLVISCFTFF